MKKQLYFFDIILFLGGVVFVAVYTPWTARFYAGTTVMAIGFALWILARVQLGASFHAQARAHKLVTTGLYSRVRNPIYTFAQLSYFGLVVAWWKPLGFVIFASMIPFQMMRAKKEAQVLENAFGDEYRAYRARTWF